MKRFLFFLNICIALKTLPVNGDYPVVWAETHEALKKEHDLLVEKVADESREKEKYEKESSAKTRIIEDHERTIRDHERKISALEESHKHAIEDHEHEISALQTNLNSEKEDANLFRELQSKELARTNKHETSSKCLKDDPRGGYAVADWLNSINIGSFFDYESRFSHPEDCTFVFNSFDNVTAWVEPYGFYSNYHSELQHRHKMNFTLGTVGLGGGARYALSDELHISGAAGYFHSTLHWQDKTKRGINSVYFGPAVAYLYEEGFVGFSLFGIKNFYEGEDQSWDLDARLESEYGFSIPLDLSLHPFIRMDYLNVFEKYNSNKSSFLYSKLGIKCEKMFLCHESGVLTGNIDLSWINMLPLTAGTLKECHDLNLKTETKNQLGLGFEIVGMHVSGLLAGIGYEAAIGSNAPMQTGRARFEWNW